MSGEHKALFLSYASQDAEAAKRICDALRQAGVEVWFDQSELVGGDAWDQKIRKQIKECALLIPIISANTQSRTEGYFRLEWRLADQRTHLMAKGRPFLLPVVIDDTRDSDAQVPDSFTEVQWTRLPGGDAAEKFSERVRKLLGHDVGPVSDRPSGSSVPSEAGQRPALPGKSRPWLIPALVSLVTVGVVAVWFARKAVPSSGASIPEARPQRSDSKPITSLTDAQKLVQQAQKIYEGSDELDRETLFLADDLVKRALVLDPAEPSAWELAAQLSYLMVWQSFDMSEARKADLQRQAARARALAPESVPARVALANARVAVAYSNFKSPSNRQDLADVERDLLALAEQAPHDYQVQRSLAQTYRFLKRPDEALRAMQRALELSGGDPGVSADAANILLRRKRSAEAEAILTSALARRPSGRVLVFDVFVKMRWRGDLAGAQAAVATWPGWLLREDRGAFVAWQTWLWSRQPERALDVAERLPRDYLHDVWFTGPRAVLTARAHELAGHREAALADWRTVVRLADQELAGSSDDVPATFWKAWALSRLGDQSGAEAVCALLQQRVATQTVFLNSTDLSLLWSTMGRTDLAAACLRTRFGADDDAYEVTRSMLELDPAYAPLRADPQFAELAAAAPAPAPKPEDRGQTSHGSGRTTGPGSAAGDNGKTEVSVPIDQKSVAVLAFANLSSDKEQEYFSDGLSENILDKLARIPGLRVMARTSSFSYKGKSVSVQQIARELHVGTVIEGSVQRAGSRLRITAQLINATDGTHVWSETYDRDLTAADIFAIQDEIALKIAAKLQPGAVPAVATAATQPTQNLAAYEAYLRGRSIEAKGFSQVRLQAVPYYEEAVRLDPGFTLAWARLAYALAWIHWGNGIIVGDELDRAQQALAAAVRLQPDLAEVHLARAAILKADGVNLGEADRELALAERRQPANPDIIYERALVARFSGRLEEALALSRRAAERDPYNSNSSNTAGIILRMLGRYPEALAAFAESARLSSGALLNFNPYLNRAITILRAEGDAAKALREFDGLPREQFDADFRTRIAGVQNAGGFHGEALAGIKAIEQPTFLSQWAFQVRALLTGRTREMMGDAVGAQRDYTEALPLAVAYRNQHPQSWRAYSAVALASAALGQKDEALAAARMALKLVPPAENPFYASQATLPVLVEVYARFGMMDEALAIVREQIAAGWWRRNDLLLLQDYFFIRKDPRFRALAEKAPL